ncbi:hypothetical protein MMC17_004168 [Xylographa soralifera]|nr:hypothetical protein [Xylographa soralifera]
MASAFQTAGRGPFSFFWLPAEVRCLIYQQLFDAQEDGAINILNFDPFHKIIPIFPSILRTCRTIYTEAIGILYKINKFLFDTVHQQPLAPLVSLFGGLRTTDLVHNVQLLVSDHELISETVPERHNTYRLVKELSKSGRQRGSFSIAFEKCWASNGTPIPVDVTNILVQSIRSLSTYKEVVIVGLPFDYHGHPAKMIWSKAFRRELESGLGPNHSLNDTRLEFRPLSKPRNWISENIAPLMKLPFPVRSRIMGLVLGPEAFFYPSRPYFDMQQSRHRTDWGLVPTIFRSNPSRNLEFLFTCRKLWEEGWQHILLQRHTIFQFDFDVVDESMNHDSTAEQSATWLPNATIILHSLDNSTNIWGTFNRLESLLRGLSKSSESPFVAQAIPEREHLILKIGIHQMRSRRYPSDKKMRLTRKEYKAYRTSHHTDIYYTERHGVPYINARNGHDIEIAKYLKQMTNWRRIDITLYSETLTSHCWRQEVTDHLEDTLGPQLSSKRGYLSFRPRYYHSLILLFGRKEAYAFMLGRKHFSDDVMDDLQDKIEGRISDNDEDNNSSDGNDDNDRGGLRNDSGGVEVIEQPMNHEHSSGNDDFSDDHSSIIDAINEFELAEALHLSALEASAAGYPMGSDNEQSGTDDENSG